MLSKKRGLCTLFLIIFSFVLSGCFSASANLTIKENGAVQYETTIAGKDFIRQFIDETKKDFKQKNKSTKIEAYKDGDMGGYKGTIEYSSIEEYAKSLSEQDGFITTIRQKKGWFFDAYSFSSIVRGNETFENEFRGNPDEKMMAKAMMADMKFSYTVNLPYAADVNDADKVTNDNKTLYWDLAETVTSDNDKSMNVQFKLWHKEHVVITVVLISGLLLLGVYVLKQSTEDREGKTKRILACSFLGIALILAGVSIYMVATPPKFTDENILGKANIEKKTIDKTDKQVSNDSQQSKINQGLAKAGQELRQKGIQGQVLASTIGHNSNGYLSLVKNGAQYQIVTNDTKNGRIGITPYDKKTLYFTDKKPVGENNESFIFSITVLHDTTDKDKDAGVWESGNHMIPVYALYKFDENGNVKPGMLSTGVGRKPSHYQGYFYEQHNVDTINLFLTEMLALQKNITDNNVTLP